MHESVGYRRFDRGERMPPDWRPGA